MEPTIKEMQNALMHWISSIVKAEIDQFNKQAVDSFNNSEVDFNPEGQSNAEELAENALSIDESNHKEKTNKNRLSNVDEVNSTEELMLSKSTSGKVSKYFLSLTNFINEMIKSATSDNKDGSNQVKNELEYIKDRVDGLSSLINNHTHSMETMEK